MSHADDVFYRQFGFVLLLLIVFALAAGYLANLFGGDALERISQSQDAVLERIKPVGSVEAAEASAAAAPAVATTTVVVATKPATAAPAPAAKAAAPAKAVVATTVVAAAAPAKSAEPAAGPAAGNMDDGGEVGEKTYKMACLACHLAGVANAPKFGDKAAWAKRAEQGLDALYNAGINGKGQLMPGKGGNATLSDDAVKAAVRYMLSGSGVTAQ